MKKVTVTSTTWKMTIDVDEKIFDDIKSYTKYDDFAEKWKDENGNECIAHDIELLLSRCDTLLSLKSLSERRLKQLENFVKNAKNKTVLDIIDKKDYDEFIDLVAESYLSRLKASPDNWVAQWENICSNDFKLNDKIYITELNKVFGKSIKNNNNFDT